VSLFKGRRILSKRLKEALFHVVITFSTYVVVTKQYAFGIAGRSRGEDHLAAFVRALCFNARTDGRVGNV